MACTVDPTARPLPPADGVPRTPPDCGVRACRGAGAPAIGWAAAHLASQLTPLWPR